MTTINVKFNPKVLPRWAQNCPDVVALCERDLGYRANVCNAQTPQMQKYLRGEAARRAQWKRAR